MTRGLSGEFFEELKGGFLAPLRERVVADKSLCLELRHNYINVYYRGGNLLRLSCETTGYTAFFDSKYFGGVERPALPQQHIRNSEDLASWLAVVPILKDAMDVFQKDTSEREVQQLIVQDNNFGKIARQTDFYVCDIEYASDSGRFDLVAVHWPSEGVARKQQDRRRLVLGEVKYGDKALAGTAGLHAHVEDVNRHLADPATLAGLKSEMVQVFNQKRALGLINCARDLVAFGDEPPLLLLVLANHDPDASRLRELLRALPPSPHAELRIASSCLLGYGLYDPAILTLEQAIARFETCL